MPGRQAKIITPTMLRPHARRRRRPSNDQPRPRHHLAVGQGGLRACEIARLDWSMVLGRARAGPPIPWPSPTRSPKGGGGRRIPMHPSLGRALGRPQTRLGAGGAGGSLGARRVHAADQHRQLVRRPVRRAWSSRAVRRIPAVAASLRRRRETRTRPAAALRDVQLLAGHKSIEITQGYIDGENRRTAGGWSRRSSSRRCVFA